MDQLIIKALRHANHPVNSSQPLEIQLMDCIIQQALQRGEGLQEVKQLLLNSSTQQLCKMLLNKQNKRMHLVAV